MAIHKYEMGVIGNCSFLDYVDLKADIKWLCMPKFDSSFIFGSLLDEEKGGHFYIVPVLKIMKVNITMFPIQMFFVQNLRHLKVGEPLKSPLIETAEDFLSKTKEYWQTWGDCKINCVKVQMNKEL